MSDFENIDGCDMEKICLARTDKEQAPASMASRSSSVIPIVWG